MEWGFWIFIVAMLGLYVWSHVSVGHRIGKRLQPFADKLFGATLSSEREIEKRT